MEGPELAAWEEEEIGPGELGGRPRRLSDGLLKLLPVPACCPLRTHQKFLNSQELSAFKA